MPENAPPAAGAAAGEGSANSGAEFRRLLADAITAAGGNVALTDREAKLLRDNFRVREKLRVAMEAATKTKALPEGAIVLEGEDAKAFVAMRDGAKALGVEIKDVPTKLKERNDLSAAEAKRAAARVYEDAAKALDIPNVRAFRRLAENEGLVITMEEQTVVLEGGEKVKELVPMVRKRDAAKDAKGEPLVDVLERDFAEDVPTLFVAPVAANAGGGNDGGAADSFASLGDGSAAPTFGARRAARGDVIDGVEGTPFPGQRRTAPTGSVTRAKTEEKIVESKVAGGAYSF